MKELKVKLTFIEPILGTSPANPDIYREFIGSHAPDAASVEDEVAALGADAVAEKSMTIFPRLDDGTPFLYDYQIKGFFKDTCGGLRKVKDSSSSKIKAYKKEIDKLIFPEPRTIPILFDGEIKECQRPLRAQTAQGERISLAMSEEIPAGATCEFTVVCLCDDPTSTLCATGWITEDSPALASGATVEKADSAGRKSSNAMEWHGRALHGLEQRRLAPESNGMVLPGTALTSNGNAEISLAMRCDGEE